MLYVAAVRLDARLALVDDVYLCDHETAYEVRISDWSSDVCSSDLGDSRAHPVVHLHQLAAAGVAGDVDVVVVVGDHLDARLGMRVLQLEDGGLVAGNDA